MEWHPASKMFPMMSDQQLQDLAEDIKANGLQEPILIDTEDRVIDGRNRLAACQMAGVTPVCEVHRDPSTIVDTVISLNLKRRHLTSSQKAAVAAKATELIAAEKEAAENRMTEGGRRGGRSSTRRRSGVVDSATETDAKPRQIIDEASRNYDSENESRTDHRIAEVFGTNRQYLADAKKVLQYDEEHGTDLYEQLLKRKITIPQAQKIMRGDDQKPAEQAEPPEPVLTFEEALAKAVRCKHVTAFQMCEWMGKSKSTGDVRKAMQAVSKASGFDVQKVEGEANTWTVSRVDHSMQGLMELFSRFALREKLEIIDRMTSDPEVMKARSAKQTLKMKRGDPALKAHQAAAERAVAVKDAARSLSGVYGKNTSWIGKALKTEDGRSDVSCVLRCLRLASEHIQSMLTKMERRCENV